MAKNYRLLREKMPEESRAKSAAKTMEMLAEMPLHELRKARQFSQAEIAHLCEMQQANISRLEQQTDMYVSTMRRFIEAMGGQLDVIARFPDGEIKIRQFSSIGDDALETTA